VPMWSQAVHSVDPYHGGSVRILYKLA